MQADKIVRFKTRNNFCISPIILFKNIPFNCEQRIRGGDKTDQH